MKKIWDNKMIRTYIVTDSIWILCALIYFFILDYVIINKNISKYWKKCSCFNLSISLLYSLLQMERITKNNCSRTSVNKNINDKGLEYENELYKRGIVPLF